MHRGGPITASKQEQMSSLLQKHQHTTWRDISAIAGLTELNRIQNTSLCVRNICDPGAQIIFIEIYASSES